MYCKNCGAELTEQSNFCPYCGSALQSATTSISLLNKAASTAQAANVYNLVLISRGSCDATMAGDLLEDVFGYTDAESSNLVKMAPVIVGENLTAEEAATVAQLYTEYGMQVSVTDNKDQYIDLTSKATSSVFDSSGKLLAGAAAIIGALTVANRISSYRRYKKPLCWSVCSTSITSRPLRHTSGISGLAWSPSRWSRGVQLSVPLRNRAEHPRECPVILPEAGTRTEVRTAMAATDVEHQ